MFERRNNRIEIEKLKMELENVKKDVENFKNIPKVLDLKYMNWLEEKELYLKELRDKISKKIEYLNKKEDNIGYDDFLKRKIFGRKSPYQEEPKI